MVPDSRLLSAVESLGYRVTVGDVAAKAGLDVRLAEQELLALASEVGGHLQVADTGDIVYLFPKNVRAILRSASLSLRLQTLKQRIWNVLFYLIRISFGMMLMASIIVVSIAVACLALASALAYMKGSNSRGYQQRRYTDPYRRGDRRYRRPSTRIFPFSLRDLLVLDHYRRRASHWYSRRRSSDRTSPNQQDDHPNMNFLEAVFSFLFGDGDPNADLGDRRWRMIGGVIRNHDGAVTAEQLAPYLDLPPVDERNSSDGLDDAILPVLQRFKGRPDVSPLGGLIYHFPALQVMAQEHDNQPVPDVLQEESWRFSLASPTQRTWVVLLGIANVVVVIAFEVMVSDAAIDRLAQFGQGIVRFVEAGYWAFFTYAIAFLLVPTLRYFRLRRTNRAVEHRNHNRVEWANQLDQPSSEVQEKLTYAQRFAAETVVSEEDLAYTTETDLMTQELLNAESMKRSN